MSFVVNAGDLTTIMPGNQIHNTTTAPISSFQPATHAQSRANELQHVALWAQANNLKLNMTKSVEMIVTHSKRKLQICYPPELPDIRRATSIRVLGVTLKNHLSVSDHVRDVISRCAQSLHALKILRCHGMSSDALKTLQVGSASQATVRCTRLVGFYKLG